MKFAALLEQSLRQGAGGSRFFSWKRRRRPSSRESTWPEGWRGGGHKADASDVPDAFSGSGSRHGAGFPVLLGREEGGYEMEGYRQFWEDETAVGVVELILILWS